MLSASLNKTFPSFLFITQQLVSSRLNTFGFTRTEKGAGRSSEVRAFAHGAVGRRINPSWGGPIVLFLVPASAPRLV